MLVGGSVYDPDPERESGFRCPRPGDEPVHRHLLGLPAFGALAAGWIAGYTGMEATIAGGASCHFMAVGPAGSDQTGAIWKDGIRFGALLLQALGAGLASSDFQRIWIAGFQPSWHGHGFRDGRINR